MAMDTGRARGAVIAEINVTPLADVMIVLLIIFMVTVPVITRQVDLPDSARAQARPDAPIVVTIRSNGSISLSDHGVVALFELSDRLRERLEGRDAVVQLNADQGLRYAQIQDVLAACREAGADEIALMTEDGTPRS